MAKTKTKKQSVPKDEVALKESGSNAENEAGGSTTPASAGKTLKVDGSATSSRKVRIHEDSPAQVAKRRVSGRRTSGAAANGAEGTSENASSNGTSEANETSEKKFSPKHKDKQQQPEKGVLKKSTNNSANASTTSSSSSSNAAQKKRKASDAVDETEVSAGTSKAAASAATAADVNAEDDEDEEGEGEIDFLAGFESGSDDEDGADSSDEENMEAEDAEDAVKVDELPKPTQQIKVNKKKNKKADVGVVYLGRIPHGFHEEEMRSYFSQFGTVTRLRLSRNKTTGASKHYAFIEFEHASVAQIVSETMDNYLLHNHILQCKVVPADQVHPKMWLGANKKFRPVPKGRLERLKHNAPKTDEQKEAIKTRLIKREEQKRDKLRELGIEYDFDGYVKTLPSKQIKDQKEEAKARTAAKKLENQVAKDNEDLEKKKVKEPRQKRARKA